LNFDNGLKAVWKSHLKIASIGLAALLMLFGTSKSLIAQDVNDYFRRNCISCHTIGGGRLTGPDLKDVSSRQSDEWLIKFMIDPKSVINRGDPYAIKLKQESREVVMPTLPGLTPELAVSLLAMIKAESALEESQYKGLQMSDEPFSAEDIERGRSIYRGTTALENGGAACISCHVVNGLPLLSGGRLGPDLTLVFERLQGRRSLASWLLAPATVTMQPLFDTKALNQSEILSLVAYFEYTAKEGGKEDRVAIMNFFLIGIVGALFGLVLFDVFWKGRFRNVRKSQVRDASAKRQSIKN